VPDTDVLDAIDPRVTALRDAVRELLDGYAEMARRLPAFGPPPEVEHALLEPLQQAADHAAALLGHATG
jgi:hypothetical protein